MSRRIIGMVAGRWAIVGMTLGVLVGGTAPPAAAGVSRQWQVAPSESPRVGVSTLYGVSVGSGGSAWAVGGRLYLPEPVSFKPLAEHWNGRAWTMFATPRRGWASFFHGVAVVSPNDAWAVGEAASPTPFIEHWNGREWSISPTPTVPPDPYGAVGTVLNSVSAVGHNDVWAGGQYGPGYPLILHWDGKQWKIVFDPQSTVINGLGILALSKNDVWAYGLQGFEHWNGHTWQRRTPAVAQGVLFISLARVPGTDHLWALGWGPNNRTVAMLWGGRGWRVHDPPPAQLGDSITARSTGDAWIAGMLPTKTMAHWNGSRWVLVTPAALRGGAIAAMALAPETHRIWAVGQRDNHVLTAVNRAS
jgi:hypothetical protein